MKTIFVAGTGTEVGKTYIATQIVTALIKSGLRVGVYKPVASGCISTDSGDAGNQSNGDNELDCEDATKLWTAAGRPLRLDAVCPQTFAAPLAPDEAARREGKVVDTDLLTGGAEIWRGHCDLLVIEGAGGLFSPLADRLLNIDLFLKFKHAKLVLVAENRLGVLHETIATCRAAAAAGAHVSRLYLSAPSNGTDASASTNKRQIEHWLPSLQVETVERNGTVAPPNFAE